MDLRLLLTLLIFSPSLATGQAHDGPVVDGTPDLQLDMDGDTLADDVHVIGLSDSTRSVVRVCLSTSGVCVDVLETTTSPATAVVARRAPGCHDFQHEGAVLVEPRPGSVCTTADALDHAAAGFEPSFFVYDRDGARFVRYWGEDATPPSIPNG